MPPCPLQFIYLNTFCLYGVNTGGRKCNFSLLAVGTSPALLAWMGAVAHHCLMELDEDHHMAVVRHEEAVIDLAQERSTSVLASTKKALKYRPSSQSDHIPVRSV